MSYVPTIGQAAFGNKWESNELPPIGEACFRVIDSEIDRVYWNINQKTHEVHDDIDWPVLKWRRYWWGEDDAPEVHLPNFEMNGVNIHWYKYPYRGMTCSVDWEPNQWNDWLVKCLEDIRNFENNSMGWSDPL